LALAVGFLAVCVAVASGCGGDDDGADGGGGDDGGPLVPPGVGDGPAVSRGDDFFGFEERFNRYYTDPDWEPTTILYASPEGGGDGSSADSPATLEEAADMVEPGTRVELAAGTYAEVCIELDDGQSGTYDQPIVFAGELRDDGSLAVRIECCGSDRGACFNLEAADHVALDSIEVVGGRYGVRAVGAAYAADEHQVGIAILRSIGHDQSNDPFFTGQSDWFVIEGVIAYGAGQDDGHGIYLSNGGDWQIVRDVELYENSSSDFQINADPLSTCDEDGVAYDSPDCDAVAGEHPTGGRGATDFALVERNYFHDGLGPGANFTSVRNSLVRNNVFAVYERHGVSFWQETDNPALGSRGNKVLHNLFVTNNGSHAVQFINSSTDNTFAQNVLLGVSLGSAPLVNPDALLLEVDGSVDGNVYTRNAYLGGRLDGREPGEGELRENGLDPGWFTRFPISLQHSVEGFVPTTAAPWSAAGEVLVDAPADMLGVMRTAPTALGPLSN
jgi:Right handed beta helix region